MGIDGDAVHYVEAKDVRTNYFNAIKLEREGEEVEKVEVEIEEVGCGGKGGGDGREEENCCSDCRIDSNHVNSMIEGSVPSTPIPLSLPLLPSKQSSMPAIFAVLRTHVHLNFPDLKCFHLLAAEEILNTYGIEFTIN